MLLSRYSLSLSAGVAWAVVWSAVGVCAEPTLNVPPKGYRALFNGKDLTGWRGMGTDNPYKLAAKSTD